MATELPIACTLTADELPARLAEMAAVGEAALCRAEVSGRRAVLRFRPSARERLERVVAAESECCAFLQMDLRHTAEAIELSIAAPEGAEPVLDEIVSAFSRERRIGA